MMIFIITRFVGTIDRNIKKSNDKQTMTQKEFNEITDKLNRLNDE